jgi:ATP-dependent DNA ligase
MRLVDLNKLFRELPKGGPLKHVKSEVAHTLEEVYQFYERFIGEGYEGFIIRELGAPYERKRSGAMMKFKPKATDHYEILSVYEAISEDGTPKGMVGGFNCIDDMATVFSVGAGKLSHDKRIQIWNDWLENPHYIHGSYLEVEYQTLSDKNKVPLFSRAVRII